MSARVIAAMLAQECSVEEIADQTGYSEEEVRQLLRSPMIKRLAKHLKMEGEKGVDHFINDDIPCLDLQEEYDLSETSIILKNWEKKYGKT